MDSLACESDEDEELGAQIYRSIQTAKAFKLGIAITLNDDDDDDDVEQGKAEHEPVLQVKNEATDHGGQQEQEQKPRAQINSLQTLCRSRRARHSTATARAGEIGNVQNHSMSIDQKQKPQQPQQSFVGNGDQIIVRRSSRKQSPTAQLLHSEEITAEVQLKLISMEENSAMEGVTKERKHDQSSTKVKQIPHKCSAEGCTNLSLKGGICYRHGGVRKTCSAQGCTNIARQRGVCIRHGAASEVRKLCSVEECTNIALRKGVCRRHGARLPRCGWVGCASGVVNGGVCMKHGAKKRICSHEGCTSTVQKGGLCQRHGKKMKRCSHKGCTNSTEAGGKCRRHSTISSI